MYKDRELFAQSGWSSWLAVRAGQHGGVYCSVGYFSDGVDHLLGGWQPDVLDSVANTQSIGQVVDVLGRARKVHQRVQVTQVECFQTGGDEVFDGFDVVNGYGFGLGQFGDRGFVEFGDD